MVKGDFFVYGGFMEHLKLEYFKRNEADSYAFYRIPKLLFTNEHFKKISIEAKLLYSMMLNRMELSIKNNWLDKDGNVFIYYTLEEAMENLGYAHTKIIRIMNELDDKKGVGLIVRKKQGQGKPTKIYVKKFIVNEVKTYKNENSEIPKAPESADNNAHNYGFESESDADFTAEEVQTSENEKSRTNKKGSTDCSDCYASNNNKNNTEFSDNQSIYPSISPLSQKTEIQKDRLSDGMSNEDVERYALHKLWQEKSIPYEFTQDYRMMKVVIHELTEWEHHKTNANNNGRYRDSFEYSTFKLFNEALIEMITDKQTIVKGAFVTYAKVYDKLAEYLKFEDTYCSIYELQGTAIGDFQVACSKRDIKNHLAYMKSCIWNAMQVGEIGIQAQIKKDFGG